MGKKIYSYYCKTFIGLQSESYRKKIKCNFRQEIKAKNESKIDFSVAEEQKPS